MSFDERVFRDALGLFPTGVAIATALSADGQPARVTVNSFRFQKQLRQLAEAA